MKQIFHKIILKTRGSGLYDFTDQTQDFINTNKLLNGIFDIVLDKSTEFLNVIIPLTEI